MFCKTNLCCFIVNTNICTHKCALQWNTCGVVWIFTIFTSMAVFLTLCVLQASSEHKTPCDFIGFLGSDQLHGAWKRKRNEATFKVHWKAKPIASQQLTGYSAKLLHLDLLFPWIHEGQDGTCFRQQLPVS